MRIVKQVGCDVRGERDLDKLNSSRELWSLTLADGTKKIIVDLINGRVDEPLDFEAFLELRLAHEVVVNVLPVRDDLHSAIRNEIRTPEQDLLLALSGAHV